jgi:hypothetical protein
MFVYTSTMMGMFPVPLALNWNQPSSREALIVLSLIICSAVCIDWLFSWPTSKIPLVPQRASAFAPHLVPEGTIATIVIGSGSGGCACANLLAQSGQKVLILEQHVTRTGGCTHSFRDPKSTCEWDTGLHYTSAAMGLANKRPGAIMNFMTRGLQQWTPLADPYDQVVFPPDEKVQVQVQQTADINDGNEGEIYPNKSSYSFVRGTDATVQSVLDNIDPSDRQDLKKRALRYMDLCQRINSGFTALGRE